MAAEVENPPVTTEEKQEESAAPAVEVPAVEAEKDAAPAEEVKEAPVVAKDAAPKKLNVFKQNFEKDVVYLYQFARTTSLPSLSPYVLKVETWLRLTGLKYEVSYVPKNLCNIHGISSKIFIQVLTLNLMWNDRSPFNWD